MLIKPPDGRILLSLVNSQSRTSACRKERGTLGGGDGYDSLSLSRQDHLFPPTHIPNLLAKLLVSEYRCLQHPNDKSKRARL